MVLRRAAALVLALSAAGCGSEVSVAPARCRFELRGRCVGVPLDPICGEELCTAGVICGAVVEVASDAELAAAVASVGAGSCIALGPGDYGAAELPNGVSLLGKSADRVRVESLRVGGGAGALVRGIELGELLVTGGADLSMHAVRVSSRRAAAVTLEQGARLGMSRSEVLAPEGRAIFAADFGALVMSRSVIADAPASGLWAQCGSGCDCSGPAPVVALDRVLVERAGLYGLALFGVSARVEESDLRDTQPGPDFQPGGAVTATACSALTANDLRIDESSGWGLLVDASSAHLGSDGGLAVNGANQGILVTHVGPGQQVRIENARLDDNAGVSLCVGGFSSHVTVARSTIARTRLAAMPGAAGTAVEIGDGVEWTAGTELVLDDLTVERSARQSVLIDGPVPAGRIESLTLRGGDEHKGVVQQKVLHESDAPQLGPGAPAISQTPAPLWEVVCP